MELGRQGVKISRLSALCSYPFYSMLTDTARKMLMEAHKGTEKQSEDHLEARIRFLQHQVSVCQCE